MSRILVFDPEVTTASRYREWLERRHLFVCTATDKVEAIALLRKQSFHLCLWSIENASEVDSLFQLKHDRPETAIVITSRRADPSLIVACMRAGASHFWSPSQDNETENADTFDKVIRETLSRSHSEEANTEEVPFPFPQFVGRHPSILEVFRLILSIKDTDSTVLITGESGTGKEVVARAIHQLSPRKRLPMVAVNCGAIPGTLLESELFGHVKGAFTGATQNRLGRFQLAGSGTLFLDEISDLSFDLQSKILRAIQQKVFEPVGSAQSSKLSARIIAATNQDLEACVEQKRFREDLYYRLNVIPIFLPPLRNRKSDIPLLVKAFLDKFSATHSKPITGVSEDAMQRLVSYQWPGNVRELENMIERVVLLKREAGIVELKDLPTHHFRVCTPDRYVPNVALPESGIDFNEAVNDFENELILQALKRTEGNKNKAATLLNLNRTTLVEKLKRKGLRVAS